MKKDNLERFVRDNREAFDDREPRPSSPANDLWQKIQTNLDRQPIQAGPELARPIQTSPFQPAHKNTYQPATLHMVWRWRVAASIAVLLLAGSFLYMNYQYGVTHQPEVVVASPSYAKEVVQYTRLIDDKRTELKQMTEDNPALYREFAQDLDRLEHSYQSLRADLPKNPNQDILIRAMIQNLHYQINLLNEQLRVIQRINHQTHEHPV